MISVTGLTKSYVTGEVTTPVLKGIDLTIEEGEYLVILGASGSGKSTFLHLLSGLDQADTGRITYGNRELTKMSEKELTRFRRENIGFIFQQYHLLPNLTVKQNIHMGAQLSKGANLEEIATKLGLSDLLDKYPSQLSGGQQQRVAIARALAKQPKVLFMDEPTGALDEDTGRSIMTYLMDLQKELKITMIMVTHNQHLAETADRVVCMKSGVIDEVVVNATPKAVSEIGW